ncbi:hypothetical protein ELI43_05070 [Rhizobium leguminosarum]|nr:hypothetical protein ELI43_05070 [Rhizobium leguminosarum]
MRSGFPRAVLLLTEAQNRSSLLFLRNSERKTASHFSWNCSRQSAKRFCRELAKTKGWSGPAFQSKAEPCWYSGLRR